MFTVSYFQPITDSNVINLDVLRYYTTNLPICYNLFLFVDYLITLDYIVFWE
jgi:hypothetical protein